MISCVAFVTHQLLVRLTLITAHGARAVLAQTIGVVMAMIALGLVLSCIIIHTDTYPHTQKVKNIRTRFSVKFCMALPVTKPNMAVAKRSTDNKSRHNLTARYCQAVAVVVSVAVALASWGTTAATRVPRLRIGEHPREGQEGSTG